MTNRYVLPALILQTYETGNTSEVVHVLTGEYGRLSVFVRGLRNSRRHLSGVIQPLAVAELTLTMREGAETANLIDAETLMDPGPIASDFERFGLGSLLAEAASVACEPGNEAPGLYAAVVEGLSLLDPRSELSAPQAAAIGLLNLLAAAGYEPSIDSDALKPWPKEKAKPRVFWIEKETGRLHLEGAQPKQDPSWPFAIPHHARQLPVPPTVPRFLYNLERQRKTTLPTAHANQFIEAMIHFLEWHVERTLRGAQFWRETHGLAEENS